MRLTFVHDGPLFYDEKGNYYEFAYHELLERYSYIADEISFMMRTKPIGKKKYTKVPSEIEVISVPNFKSIKTYFREVKRAEKIVKQQIERSDYVVLRTQSSIAQLALKYIKKLKKPYIIECVGCSWDSYWNHGLLGKIVAPYMFMTTRNAIRNAEYVYYVTSEFLQKRYPTKGKSVSCSNVVLDPPDSKVLEEREKKLRDFDPNKKIILGTAAAIDTRYKGHEHVIQAIPELVRRGYNVEYHLAGGLTGSKPNTFLADLAVEYQVEDRVIFKGSLSADQMWEYYDSLDIYVQPSKQEGLPRAVIEAMSRGCPAIGTNIAGIPELIQPEYLFRKGSSQEIVDALERILKGNLFAVAQQNFSKAQLYEKDKLREKREAFYSIFLENSNVQNTLYSFQK